MNRGDTASALKEFTFFWREIDNKPGNTLTRSFQTMLCAVKKIKSRAGCRVIWRVGPLLIKPQVREGPLSHGIHAETCEVGKSPMAVEGKGFPGRGVGNEKVPRGKCLFAGGTAKCPLRPE